MPLFAALSSERSYSLVKPPAAPASAKEHVARAGSYPGACTSPTTHALLPTGAVVPCGHGAHRADAASAVKVSSAQGVHALDEPPALKVPGSHGR